MAEFGRQDGASPYARRSVNSSRSSAGSSRSTPSPLELTTREKRISPVISFPGPPKRSPPPGLRGSSPRSSPDHSPVMVKKLSGIIRSDSPLTNGTDRTQVISAGSTDVTDGRPAATAGKPSNGVATATGGNSNEATPVTSPMGDNTEMHDGKVHAVGDGARDRHLAPLSPGHGESDTGSLATPMIDVSANSLANMLSGFSVPEMRTPSPNAPTPDDAFYSPSGEDSTPATPVRPATLQHAPLATTSATAAADSPKNRVLQTRLVTGRCDSPKHTTIEHVMSPPPSTSAATAAASKMERSSSSESQRGLHDKGLWEKIVVPNWAALLDTVKINDMASELLKMDLLTMEQVTSLKSGSDDASATARMVSYIGTGGDSAVITFVRIVSEVANRKATYKHLVLRLQDMLRRELSSYFSDGSSRHSVNASLSGNSVSTPSPPVRTSLLSTGSASFNHQISTGSTGVTASHMLDVSNIRLHLYDAHIDDDSVYDSSDNRMSSDISPVRSRRTSLHEVVAYSPRATMERDKKPPAARSAAARPYTELIIPPPLAPKKKKSAPRSPLATRTASRDSPSMARVVGANGPEHTPPARNRKSRRNRSRAGDLDTIISSSSEEDDSPRLRDVRRASSKKQHLSKETDDPQQKEMRPTLSGQIAELGRLQDELRSTCEHLESAGAKVQSPKEDDDDDDDDDHVPPIAANLARDSLFQKKYNEMQRSPTDELTDIAAPGALARDSLQVPSIIEKRSRSGSSDRVYAPSTPPHSVIQHSTSYLGGTDNSDDSQEDPEATVTLSTANKRIRQSVYSAHNLMPSFYDTTTTLSPSPVVLASQYSTGPPGTPDSVEVDSPVSKSPSPVPTTDASGVIRTHQELWMTTWIQEYLEVDAEFIDVFQMRVPTDDKPLVDPCKSSKSLIHLLIEDLTLAQFKQQRQDTLVSIAELLYVPFAVLKVIVRQVNEHAILVSLSLPRFCCAQATEMASDKNRRLTSHGIAMVISDGRRIWCGQDRVGKGSLLSKVKQRLRSNDEKKVYEMMEINVDHVAMELYELVAPIPKAVWHGALAGNLNILNMLKSVNCDFNESDQGGDTPLHICCQVGHVEALKFLLDNGALPDIRNKGHITPLHWAANQGNAEVARILLEHGASVNAVELRHRATPAHIACMMGHVDVLEVLIQHGADVSAVDKHQNTGLHLAILFAPVDPQEDIAKSELYSDVVEVLLSSKVQASACGVSWITPLHLACANGQEYLVELLLKYGANVNALDQELWQTPLHYAVMAEHSSVAELLVIAGAKVGVTDKNQQSPLDLAETVSLKAALEVSMRDTALETGGVVSPSSPTVCVVGDSGSGKSSFIQCICASVQRRQTFGSNAGGGSDDSVAFDTPTQRFNSFRVNLADDISVILRDVPAGVQYHLPYCSYLGNKTSIFVVMLSALETFEEQIRSANAWLELIAFSCMAVAVRPTVLLVTSHVDMTMGGTVPTGYMLSERTVNTLADHYDGVMNITRRMYFLNCRTPYSTPMSALVDDVSVEALELMRTCRIPELCNDVILLLPELQCQYAVPIVEFDLFERLVKQQLPTIEINAAIMKNIATYLHDLGQLVCVSDKNGEPMMIVLEPDWLCWDGFGRLMRPASPEQDTVNPALTRAAGKVSQAGLQKLFSTIPCSADVLVQLLRFCSMCVPIEDHFQLTSTMLGLDTDQIVMGVRQECWSKDPVFTRYAGRRWAMEEGQPFPGSVVSWLQVACGDHLSKGVLATMTTWHTGFKLATENGIAEALVELTLDRQNLQLLVRCTKDARQQCAMLLQHLTNMVTDTLSARLRGVDTELAAISPRQLRTSASGPGEHFDCVPFTAALNVYRSFLCGQSASAQTIAEQNTQPQRGRQMVASFINIGGKLEKLSDVLLLDEGDIRLIAQSVFGRTLCERFLAQQYEDLARDLEASGQDPDMAFQISPLNIEEIPPSLAQAAVALRVPAMPLLWRWMAQPWLGMLRRWQGRQQSSWIRLQHTLRLVSDSNGEGEEQVD